MINKKTVRGYAIDFLNRAVSTDETRYFMNGIHFDAENLNIVATDGKRLHMVKCNDKGIFDAFVADLGITTKEQKNIFMVEFVGNNYISTTAIDGQFPNYHRVIPEDNGLLRTDIDINYPKPTAKNDEKTKVYGQLVFALGKLGFIFNLNFIIDLHSITWDNFYRSPDTESIPSQDRSIKLTGKDNFFIYTAVIMPRSTEERIEL